MKKSRKRKRRQIRRKTIKPRVEGLEQRLLLAADWQNTQLPLNVDNDVDGIVSPIDALLAINELILREFTDPDTGILLFDRPDDAPFLDVDNDTYVSPLDALQVINWLNGFTSPPSLIAGLTYDSAPGGATNSDLLTFDPGLSGTISDDTGPGVRLLASVDGGDPIAVEVADNGSFEFDPGLARDGTNDGPHSITLTAVDNSGQTDETTVSFALDTLSPTAAAFSLDANSRLEADNPALTDLSLVTVEGQTDPGQLVTLVQTGDSMIAAGDGSFSFANLPITDGLNPYSTRVEDAAGNVNRFGLSIGKLIADPGEDPITFSESATWVVEQALRIELGHDDGSRQYSFDIESSFDESDADILVGDLFQVYLVDPMNPGNTLLDRGREGEALFSLGETGHDFLPGLVTYDGTTVTVDLTSLSNHTEGLLIFQLINGDSDDGTTITVSNRLNAVDGEGTESPLFTADAVLTSLGEDIDLSGYTTVTGGLIYPIVENVRVDGELGTYKADITLRNIGDPASRQMAIRFNDFPADVEVINASGTDVTTGLPYFNLAPAIPSGGLDVGAMTAVVGLEISNPNATRFELDFDILTKGVNQGPNIDSIGDVTTTPGETVTVSLAGSDPDGDNVRFSVINAQELPNNNLRNGELTFTPIPSQLGTYTVVVSATDGLLSTTREFTLNVVADPISSTRLSGRVMDSNGITSLAGIPVELVETDMSGFPVVIGSGTTDSRGYFTIEAVGLTPNGTLKVRADDVNFPNREYPFVAENIHLVLDEGPFDAINNIIARPIYLPVLDVEGGANVEPGQATVVSQEIAPGDTAELFLAEDSVLTPSGTAFTGVVHITEVPADFTPAALPLEFNPSTVVTIQPGEMTFTTPAELTLPNREGYLPGTEMTLWSINPSTGLFDDVGTGVVSADGKFVETVAGGVLNSSWHFFNPMPNFTGSNNAQRTTENQSLGCGCGDEAIFETNSYLELHSGAIRETHELAGYNSLGVDRGLTLHYNSQRADPRPIIYFGLSGDLDPVSSGIQDLVLVGRVSLSRGTYFEYIEGFGGNPNLPDDFDHFFSLPDTVVGDSDITTAVQGDLRSQPSGIYNATVENSVYIYDGAFAGNFAGTNSSASVPVVHVNSIESPFGAGWELAGVQQLIENPSGELLLIDGDSRELVFLPQGNGMAYESPPGDFSTLVKNSGGTYTRTTKYQTIYEFNVAGQLVSVTDRNGNRTEHVYENDRLVSIIDPVGLETTLNYVDGRVRTITDPSGRITELTYTNGQLTQITDPDNTMRQFGYDTLNHLVIETDQNNHTETTVYGAHGRAQLSIRKDGTELDYAPLQTAILERIVGNASGGDGVFPEAEQRTPEGLTSISDAVGSVRRIEVDQIGQFVAGSDGIGLQVATVRNEVGNLVSSSESARRYHTNYSYDDLGNIVAITDTISQGTRVSAFPSPTITLPVANETTTFNSEDLNDDGIADLIVGAYDIDDVTRRAWILAGEQDGTFSPVRPLASPRNLDSVSSGDFNGDSIPDIFLADSSGLTVLLGLSNFEYSAAQRYATGVFHTSLRTLDFNNDALTDILTINPIDNRLTLLPGSSDGSSELIEIHVDESPTGLVVDDFNNDGRPDFAVTQSTLDRLLVFQSQGDGSFLPASPLSVGPNPSFVTSGDFNGDGLEDLAVATDDGIATLYGDPAGGFFTPVTLAVDGQVGPLDAFNLDNDEFDDIALSVDRKVGVRLGSNFDVIQNYSIPTAGRNGRAAAIARDFNNDGRIDIMSAGTYGLPIMIGNGDGTFGSTNGTETGYAASAATALDGNNDGIADFARTTAADDTVTLEIGTGDGSFSTGVSSQVGQHPVDVIAADFNGDNLTDLATANSASNDVTVLIQQLDGSFANDSFDVGISPWKLIAADFNGDDLIDLATANNGPVDPLSGDRDSADISVLLNLGSGVFAAETRTSSQFYSHERIQSITSGDYNGDGRSDFAVAHYSIFDGSLVSTLLSQSDNTFEAVHFSTNSFGFGSLASGDFDGDGREDLVSANFGSLSILTGLGNGQFQPAMGGSQVGPPVGQPIVADLNDDGLVDVAARIGFGEAVAVWLGDLEENLSFLGTFSSGPGEISTADFNNDGITDLGTGAGTSIQVLLGSQGESSTDATRLMLYEQVFSQLIQTTDELDRTTTFDIDPANGNRLAIREPNSEFGELVTQFEYTPEGLVELMTDPLNRQTRFMYDDVGLLMQTTFAVGTVDEATQHFDYDDAGNMVLFVDEKGNHTVYEYDDMNRLTRTTEEDPDGPGPLRSPVSEYDYDARGNLIWMRDPEGSVTRFEYDPMDRLRKTIDDNQQEMVSTYFPDGNLKDVTDENGNVTQHQYDARDRRVLTIDPDGGRTRFRYDLDNNLVQLTDPVENETRFFYDSRDRMFREIDPRDRETNYDYDAVNNLVSMQDRNGRVTEYNYDLTNRLTTERWTSAAGAAVNTIEYDYDKNSNLLSVSDNVSSLTYTYDFRDRVEVVDNMGTMVGSGLPPVRLTYDYDDVGNVTSVSETIGISAGATTSFEFDRLNRVEEIRQSGGGASEKLVDLVYNRLGQFDEMSRYSDVTRSNLVARTDYGYDNLNRLTILEHGSVANPRDIAFYDFDYDNASRITAITDIDGHTSFGYDDRDQLTSADRDAGDVRGDESYNYDANGNRITATFDDENRTYSTGDANRLMSDGSYNYLYDDEGNMTRRTEIVSGDYRTFEYDHRNRLTDVRDFESDGTLVQHVEFVYDSIDRRIAKAVTDTAGERTEHFVYDGQQVLLDFVDSDGSGAAAQPELTTRYLFGPGIDNIISQEVQGSTQWMLTDHLGTIHDIVDNSGMSVSHIVFDSFGNVVSPENSQLATRYLFTGREFNPELDLYYFRARFYDSGIGRFLSEDPVLANNLYPYVSGSPLVATDPLGQDGIDIFDGQWQDIVARLLSDGSTAEAWHRIHNRRLGIVDGRRTGVKDNRPSVAAAEHYLGYRMSAEAMGPFGVVVPAAAYLYEYGKFAGEEVGVWTCLETAVRLVGLEPPPRTPASYSRMLVGFQGAVDGMPWLTQSGDVYRYVFEGNQRLTAYGENSLESRLRSTLRPWEEAPRY